jgi:hypothetical protein
MEQHDASCPLQDRWQFSLAGLLECVTCCAVVGAFAGAIGPVATALLVAMAVALGAAQGSVAIALFAAAILASEWIPPARSLEPATAPTIVPAAIVMLLAVALSGWYAVRRRLVARTL